MFMSLFINTLLYLSLTRLIIKPKIGFELIFFTKENEHKHSFPRSELELFMNSLVYLQFYPYYIVRT